MTGITKTTPSTATQSAWTSVHPALGVSPMDHLFNRMDGIYMGKWRKEFTSTVAIENWREAWAEAFSEEGITFDEIKRGIVTCRKQYDWAPSLPEFIKACRPALDYEVAYHEAVKQMGIRYRQLRPDKLKPGEQQVHDQWSHPAVFWAAAELGTDLTDYSYPQVKLRWKNALDGALAKPKGEVPKVVLALEAPGVITVSPEEAKKRIAAALELIGRGTKPKTARKRFNDDDLEDRKREMAKAIKELEDHRGAQS